MKAGGIVVVVVAGLMLAGSAFFGIFSVKNAGSADRMEMYSARRRHGQRFGMLIAERIRRKSRSQRDIALGLGLVGVLGLVGGIVMIKKGKKGAGAPEQQAMATATPGDSRGKPGVVLAAGILWIACGALAVLGNLIAAAAVRRGGGSVAVGLPVAIAFFVVGIQTVSGKAKDVLGNSIGSLIIGGLGVIGVLVLTMMARHGVVLLAMVYPLGLITAGILALVGRQRYLAYRASQEGTAVPAGAQASGAAIQPVVAVAAAPAIPSGPLPQDNWYVGGDGQQQGPLSMLQLRQSIGRGEVATGAHVFHAALGQWMPITNVPMLAKALARSPLPGVPAAATGPQQTSAASQ